jgi:hypothetical protein
MRSVVLRNKQLLLVDLVGSPSRWATLYRHPGDPRQILKILNKPEGEKLKALIAKPPQGTSYLAWPTDLVFDESDQIIGFASQMFRNTAPVHEFYNPVHRPPEISIRFLYELAYRIAKNLSNLHAAGYVRVDTNFFNTLVTRSGAALEIDLDSMRVETAGRVYRAKEATDEFHAAEVLGANKFEDFDFTTSQDSWAAGVLFHRLLRDGAHPCDFEYVGPGTRPSLLDSIKRGYWAESGKHSDIRPLKNVTPFAKLPHGVQHLFYQTFELGFSDPAKRPSMDDWVAELAKHRPIRATLSRRVWLEITQSAASARKPWPTLGPAGKNLLKGTVAAAAVGIAAYGAYSFLPRSLQATGEPAAAHFNVASPQKVIEPLVPYTPLSGSVTPTGAPNKPALWAQSFQHSR